MPLLLSLLLAACAPPSAAPAPSDLPPPPNAPIVVVGPAYAGYNARVYVDDIPVGTRIRFYASVVGTGRGPCSPAGPCFGIRAPGEVGVAVAGANRRASLTIPLPSTPGSTWVQAVVLQPQVAVSQVTEVQILPTDHDTDGDGLADPEEHQAGTDLYVADTDGDTLSDGDEVHLHGTDPLLRDTDDDAANDAREVELGLDPLDPDMDGDGAPDGLDLHPIVADPPDPHVVVDVLATAGTIDLPDPEFDNTEGRVVWQTAQGEEVWLAAIDPNTGDLVPSDGRGTLLDRDVGPISIGKNGPEWAYSDRGPQALWTRTTGFGLLSLARAVRGPQGWSVSDIIDSDNQATPIGSLDPGDPRPRTIWYTSNGFFPGLGWRELDDPTQQDLLPLYLSKARWVEGNRIISGNAWDGHTLQVYTWEIDSQRLTRLTSSPMAKGSTFFWYAPEYNNELVFFTTHGDANNNPVEIVLYRMIGGAWTPTLTIPMPPALPYVISPEPFVWQGRSYVAYISSNEPLNSDNGRAVIWIASMDINQPLVRRVSEDHVAVRKDPESFTWGARPWVFYSEKPRAGVSTLRRCELGL
jgi:hypothetical protein